MKFFYLIPVFIIFLSFIAFAEEFNFKYGVPITYKGIEIKLISVGNEGTIKLKIQNQDKYIRPNEEILLYDIKFKNLDSDPVYQSAKVSMDLMAECLIDEDCIKSNPCRKAVCNYRQCEFQDETKGCPFNSECKSFFSFEEVNNQLSYCSSEGSWEPRKPYKESCEHNYECLSNICDSKFCDKPLFGGDSKMAPAWILIAIGALLLAGGAFFFLKSNLTKTILRNISFWRDNTWRIIGVITIILALALIIWALA